VESKPLISEKALKAAVGRFGLPGLLPLLREVDRAVVLLRQRNLRITLTSILSVPPPERRGYQATPSAKEMDRKIQMLQTLLQDSSETQEELTSLVKRINGVSEPATVPHQSPRAGDTPGVTCES
jgi:hypothetical protein